MFFFLDSSFLSLDDSIKCMTLQDQFGAPVLGQNITKKMYEKVAPRKMKTWSFLMFFGGELQITSDFQRQFRVKI